MSKHILSIFFRNWHKVIPQTKSKQALEQLANWAQKFSPIVAVDSASEKLDSPLHFGINLDVTGSIRLYKGKENLVATITKELESFGLACKTTLSPTLGASWALSRYGLEEHLIISKDELKNALRPLPLRSLRISNSIIALLEELHIFHLNYLLDLPRSSLAKRFPLELITSLDSALGFIEEPIRVSKKNMPIKVSGSFASPISDLSQVIFVAEKLLSHLLEKILPLDRKLSTLVFAAKTARQVTTIKISFNVATANKKHIWAQLKTQLKQKIESATFTEPIEAISLSAPLTEALCKIPSSFIANSSEHNAECHKNYGELLDTLFSNLGDDAIRKLVPGASHIPEKSFSYLPLSKATNVTLSPLVNAKRPSFLFYAPQAVATLSLPPDGAPLQISWKGKKFRVISSIGPERIAPEWWGNDERLCFNRDYFRIQVNSGEWLWVFKELETANWFIHGIWA